MQVKNQEVVPLIILNYERIIMVTVFFFFWKSRFKNIVTSVNPTIEVQMLNYYHFFQFKCFLVAFKFLHVLIFSAQSLND